MMLSKSNKSKKPEPNPIETAIGKRAKPKEIPVAPSLPTQNTPTFAEVKIQDELSPQEMVTLEEIFRRADVVSLHCPLTPHTGNIVNDRNLALMKETAFLINTSRGPLIDEQALAEALNNGRIAGAGLDVLAVEPPDEQNPLLKARNCYVTPHIAWATRAARARLLNIAVENVAAFVEGKPENVVN